MHRIDVPSATVDNKFTEGSPAGGVPATTVPAAWLNDLQENIAEAIEAGGIALTKGDYTQLAAAISALALGILPDRSFAQNDFIRIPDVAGGLIVQWCRTPALSNTAFTTVTLPIAFPSLKIGGVVTQPGTTIDTASFKVRDDADLNSVGVLCSVATASGFCIVLGN